MTSFQATGVAVNSPAFGSCSIAPIRTATLATNQLLMYNGNEVVVSSDTTSAAAKSFVIPHPLDSARYLVHACLEGPENGVYYRGVSRTAGGHVKVQLPDYVHVLASEFTVHLTQIWCDTDNMALLAASKVSEGSFTVFATSDVSFSWIVHGTRGPLDVEPRVTDTQVCGEVMSPYRWIGPRSL